MKIETATDWIGEFIANHGLVVAVILAALYVGYLKAGWEAEKEIGEVRLEQAETIIKSRAYEEDMAKLKEQVDGLELELSDIDEQLTTAKASETAALKRVDDLEGQKVADRLAVDMLHDSDKSLDLFVETFPKLSRAGDFGKLEVESSNGLTIDFVAMPLTFLDAFVKNKQVLNTADEQLKEYGGITKIRAVIERLNHDYARALRKVATLEANAFTACEAIRVDMTDTLLARQDKHIATLEKPRIDFSNKVVTAGAFVAGGVIGGIIGNKMCGGGQTINLQGDF